jgi:hypothetical protein
MAESRVLFDAETKNLTLARAGNWTQGRGDQFRNAVNLSEVPLVYQTAKNWEPVSLYIRSKLSTISGKLE